MGYGISIVPETLRTNAADVDGTYRAVGSALEHPVRYLKFINLTDQTVIFSWNGVHDHFILPENGFDVIDIATNKELSSAAFVSKGTQFYVKAAGASPTAGTKVYISVLYGYGD